MTRVVKGSVVAVLLLLGALMTAPSTASATYNVLDYGAIGDGLADDTRAVQAAVTAAAGRGTVVVPAGTYLTSATVVVPGNTSVSGSGVIKQVTAGVSGLRITGSGVTVEGITLTGPNASPTYSSGEYGIEATGTAGSPLRQIAVRNVSLSRWGAYGMYLQHVTEFDLSGCSLSEIGYTGIGVLTGTYGTIAENRVDSITPGAEGNSYGIIVSYADADAESTDIVVRGNTVSRVFWEGIDAHGGSRLTIDNNTVRNSGDGIALAQGSTAAHVGSNNVVTNNLVEDASKRGIVVVGQAGTPRAANTISNNTLRRTAEGVLAFYTKDMVVSNNIIQESNAIGVFLDHDNVDFEVTGNAFIDMWSNNAWTAGVHVADTTNTGLVTRNTLLHSSKQDVTYLNDYGYHGVPTGVTLRDNDFTAATDAAAVSDG